VLVDVPHKVPSEPQGLFALMEAATFTQRAGRSNIEDTVVGKRREKVESVPKQRILQTLLAGVQKNDQNDGETDASYGGNTSKEWQTRIKRFLVHETTCRVLSYLLLLDVILIVVASNIEIEVLDRHVRTMAGDV
jgi:hypothetical protein